MKYYGIQNEVKSYINRLQSEQGIVASPSTIKTINDRVENLKKSGVWSQYSLGFNDVDADAYLTRAGVADPLGRCEVLWFTRGMKALDLWNNMTCWPMRKRQNAGAGTIIYSLGGQGLSNATIFTPALAEWSIDGLRVLDNVSGSFARATYKVITQNEFPLSIYTVNRKSGSGISNNRSICQIGNSTDNINLLRTGLTSSDRYTLSVTGMSNIINDVALGIFYPIYCMIDKGRVLFNVNLGATTTNTPVLSTFSATNVLTFSVCSPTGTGDSTQSVLIILPNKEANNQLLNNLYKNTLGNGLGLP